MKKLLFPVIILCLFLYARPKSEGNPVPLITKETKAATVVSPKLKAVACGPFLTVYNSYPHFVNHLIIKIDGTTYLDVSSPSFPYYVPGPLPNGNYSVMVTFNPFSTYNGTLRVTNSAGLYACAPFLGSWAPAVNFTPGCDSYDITISAIAGC